MSEEKNVQKRVVNTQPQPDNTFERVLSHMGVIERHFKDDLNWIDTISKNDVLFDAACSCPQSIFYSRMGHIQDDMHSLLSMSGYLKDKYGVGKIGITDAYYFDNSHEFLIISLQNDLYRLIDMAKALLDMYDNIIEDNENDEMPSVDFHALTKQREEEMKDKE